MKRILGTICLGLAVLSAVALLFLVVMTTDVVRTIDANEQFGTSDPVRYMAAFYGVSLLLLIVGFGLAGRWLRRAV